MDNYAIKSYLNVYTMYLLLGSVIKAGSREIISETETVHPFTGTARSRRSERRGVILANTGQGLTESNQITDRSVSPAEISKGRPRRQMK